MRIIEPEVHVLSEIDPEKMLHMLEYAGRTCYKSSSEYTPETRRKFVGMILSRNHESVVEHVSMTAKFTCDRGVSHELVRQRIASFSQESTRFCNYSKDKFGDEITVIRPFFFPQCAPENEPHPGGKPSGDCPVCARYRSWRVACVMAEASYLELLKDGAKPEEARSVLPNSLKTEIVVTANLREWRHIFELRTAPAAHPQMRQVMQPLLAFMYERLPELFQEQRLKMDNAIEEKRPPWAKVIYSPSTVWMTKET